MNGFIGAEDGARTRHLKLGRLSLYQMSYFRDFNEQLIMKNYYSLFIINYPLILVGGEGFEPPKASPTDLQSAPFSHSGILPLG